MQEQHRLALPAVLAGGGSVVHSLPRAVLATLASQPSARMAPRPVPAPSLPSSASYVRSTVVIIINSSISLLSSWPLGSGVLGFAVISSSSETESCLSTQRGRRTTEHRHPALAPTLLRAGARAHLCSHSTPGSQPATGQFCPLSHGVCWQGQGPCCGSVGQELR